ncbi:MAG: ParB/RepB/Spo0J family partition protein [Phycisphaerales bacterium]
MTISVSLSKLVCSRLNVRRVKPEREAHRIMVASVKAFGLLEPLLVRKVEGEDRYDVIDGKRRLAALRVVHRGENPRIECSPKNVDDHTARAISLSANYTQLKMHPLDESEAFARLATEDGKGVEEIAIEFGVSDSYIRQRMKLAGLASPIKHAYREGKIDTATAEVFASVPADRQEEVWQEVNGNPHNAQQVRRIIEAAWIDSGKALFDPSTLPPSAVSSDLFAEKVLIERGAFMQAQQQALNAKREALTEDGWAEVVVAERGEVQDRLYKMDEPQPAYDAKTTKKLHSLDKRREALEQQESEDAEAYDALDQEEAEIIGGAEVFFDEATKANGTVFLLLDPDGRTRTEYRLPRKREGTAKEIKAPTIDDLSDGQQAAAYTHEAIAVREAVADQPLVMKRLLVVALHSHVRREGLAINTNANSTTCLGDQGGMSKSDAHDARQLALREIDPLATQHFASETDAYEAVKHLREKRLDQLIEALTINLLTAHPARSTPLIQMLRRDLRVDIRKLWTPDATWLAGYKKCQLVELIGELQGHVYTHATKQAKKSDLVESLAKLFGEAAAGQMADKDMSERFNRWLPVNLRQQPQAELAEAA